jgi:N-glycosylase/DNA lyase
LAKVKEEVEAAIITKREMISNAQLLLEVKEWIKDHVYSRTRNTKYFRISKTYWLVKMLVAQDLEKAKEDQQELLHSIKNFEGKFEADYSAVFGVKIIVTKAIDEDGKGKTRFGSNSFMGTYVNPIKVDDVPQ